MVCKDEAGNISAPGSSSSPTTNEARGIPTIAYKPLDGGYPVQFRADGDLSEWYDSGIMPFEIDLNNGNVWNNVDDMEDLNATVFMAITDDSLYFAAEVIDDSYSFDDEGNWWDQDAFQLFLGLYDERGEKHHEIMRGEEPDYIFYANENTLQLDNPNNISLADPGSWNYHFEVFNPDYLLEGAISLDELAEISGDSRFEPKRGMRIPIDIYFHDRDYGNWEGILGFSPFASDQQWTSRDGRIHGSEIHSHS